MISSILFISLWLLILVELNVSDMKYVVFNGKDCNNTGDFGPTCLVYNNRSVLEVVRIDTGRYNIYWDTPFDDNNYIILTSSNVDGTGGAYSSIGGNDDSLDVHFGVSRRFVTVQTRKLGGSLSFADSDYIVLVADIDIDGMKKIVFDGLDSSCNNNGQFGSSCNILSDNTNNEIFEVIVESQLNTATIYDIFFKDSFINNDYLVLTSSNVQGTGGSITSIGGNNNINSANNGINTDVCRIDTRQLNGNQRGQSDYVSFIAGIPLNIDESIKYVTFDGTDCNGNGSNGATCHIFDSNDISEVVKINNGIYRIFWLNDFENNNYVLLCDSNLRGTGGAACSIGGNNIASSGVFFGISTVFGEVEVRDIDTNLRANSDYISVLAF